MKLEQLEGGALTALAVGRGEERDYPMGSCRKRLIFALKCRLKPIKPTQLGQALAKQLK